MLLIEAMAHQEGYYARGVAKNRPQSDDNPLDLRWCAESKSFGALRGDRPATGNPALDFAGYSGFAVFASEHDGYAAAARWLSVPAKFHAGPLPGLFCDPNGTTLVAGYLGATYAQFIHRFAPPNENNTQAYVDYVCTQTGRLPTDVLTAEMLAIPNPTSEESQ